MKTWEDLQSDFIGYLKIERGLAENSVQNYALDIEKLRRFLSEASWQLSPLKIETEALQQFLYETAKSQSARSQARLISGLRSFFDYLVFEEYRESNPLELIEAPKSEKRLPDVLSEEEIDRILEAIDLAHPQGERNYTIVETLYSCGLRVSELTHLRISDLFFEEGFIRIEGKGSKQRLVPVSDHLIKLVMGYRENSRLQLPIKRDYADVLFLNRRGRQLTRAMIFTLIKSAAKKAGFQKKVSPHTFRHSFATHLLQNGANIRAIQQMLGHENIVTTEVYLDMDDGFLREVIEKYHPRA